MLKRNPSPAQIAAARRNGAKSKGPTSPQGKRHSSQNAITHGARTQALLLPGESPDDFASFHQSLAGIHQPATPLEHAALQEMAECQWRIDRLVRTQTERVNRELEQGHSTLQAFQNSNWQAFEHAESRLDARRNRAERWLLALQKKRRCANKPQNPLKTQHAASAGGRTIEANQTHAQYKKEERTPERIEE